MENLCARSQAVLKVLVIEYMRSGEPVGSQTLAHMGGMNLSPAALRSTMADLEKSGFLISPHASAGRLPSANGIRFFVEYLLILKPLQGTILDKLQKGMRGDTTDDLLDAAAKVLSRLTRYIGFVTVAPPDFPKIKKLRFVRLSSERVLAVIVTDEGEMLNRVFSYDNSGERNLETAARFYNRHFSGFSFPEAKKVLLRSMGDLRREISRPLRRLLDALSQKPPERDDGVKMAGELNLLVQRDLFKDMGRLRKLCRLLEHKKNIMELLERCGYTDDARIFIGNECGHEALRDCSMIVSPYEENIKIRPPELVGVIGPKRMKYNRVIPTVEMAAELLAGT